VGWVWDNPAERAHRIVTTAAELRPPTPAELQGLVVLPTGRQRVRVGPRPRRHNRDRRKEGRRGATGSIGRVVPRHASCTKFHKPVDLGRLFGRGGDLEIEMDPRPLLDRSDRPMHSDPCSDAVGRNKDRVVTGAREPDDFVAQHVSPEGGARSASSAPKMIVPRRGTTRLSRSLRTCPGGRDQRTGRRSAPESGLDVFGVARFGSVCGGVPRV
jgi:hypothetical protein